MSRVLCASASVVGLALLVPGCSAEPEGLPPIDFDAAVVWESEHFQYYVQEGDDSVCEDVMETLEQHFTAIRDYLDFPWPEGHKVKYYKLVEGDDPRDFGCFGDARACYRGQGEIISPEVFHKHELIHAYVGPIDYDLALPRPGYLQEGLAEALGSESLLTGISPQPWREFFGESVHDNQYLLPQAAWFVGYLLKVYGPSAFLQWFQQVDYTDSVDRMAQEFEDVYEVSVDEAWEGSLAYGSLTPRAVLAFECREPEIVPSTEEISIDQSSCSGQRSATLQFDGTETVSVYSADSPRPIFLSCDADYWVPWLDFNLLGKAPEGVYLVETAGEDTTMVFRERRPNLFVESCETGEAVSLPEVEEGFANTGITLSAPPGHWYLTLTSPPGPHVLQVESLTGVTLEVCAGCSGECLDLDWRDEADFDANGRILLRMVAEEPVDGRAAYARLELVAE